MHIFSYFNPAWDKNGKTKIKYFTFKASNFLRTQCGTKAINENVS